MQFANQDNMQLREHLRMKKQFPHMQFVQIIPSKLNVI